MGTGSSNTNISECLSVNLGIVERITKELDESNEITKVSDVITREDVLMHTFVGTQSRRLNRDHYQCLEEVELP